MGHAVSAHPAERNRGCRSRCPFTDRTVELVVAPDGVKSSRPEDLHVSFPSLAATDTANITGSFCCDVFFLAGTGAARTWRATHAEGMVLDLRGRMSSGVVQSSRCSDPLPQQAWR